MRARPICMSSPSPVFMSLSLSLCASCVLPSGCVWSAQIDTVDTSRSARFFQNNIHSMWPPEIPPASTPHRS
uniref:Putative secreted protein n=1 Tax=Anopheles marajoara TaxID=58244 RepID=A0A2M4CE80_9DIPT